MPDDSGRPDLTLIAEERAAEEREHEPGGGGESEPPDPGPFRGLHYQDETGLHLLANGLVDAADGTVLVKSTVGGKPVLLLEDMTETGGIPATQKGAAGGVAELDGSGLLPLAELPALVAADVGADVAGAAATAQAAAEAASAQGFTPTAVQSAAYTTSPGEYVPVDISGGSVAVKLPAKPADKTRIALKIIAVSETPGSTTLTINRGGEADVFNIAGGSTSLKLSAKFQGIVLQYKASTGIWYVQTTDTPLNEALGAALLGTDATVGGPSGSPLSPSVVSSSANPSEAGQIPVSAGSTSRAVIFDTPAAAGLATMTQLEATNTTVDAITSATEAITSLWLPKQQFDNLEHATAAIFSARLGGWQMAHGETSLISAAIRVPVGWNTMTVSVVWINLVANTGNVSFQVGWHEWVAGSQINTTPTSPTIGVAAANATPGIVVVSTSAAQAVQPSKTQTLRLGRNGSSGSDTLPNNILVLGATLTKAS
jgi:hypothetical protein